MAQNNTKQFRVVNLLTPYISKVEASQMTQHDYVCKYPRHYGSMQVTNERDGAKVICVVLNMAVLTLVRNDSFFRDSDGQCTRLWHTDYRREVFDTIGTKVCDGEASCFNLLQIEHREDRSQTAMLI